MWGIVRQSVNFIPYCWYPSWCPACYYSLTWQLALNVELDSQASELFSSALYQKPQLNTSSKRIVSLPDLIYQTKMAERERFICKYQASSKARRTQNIHMTDPLFQILLITPPCAPAWRPQRCGCRQLRVSPRNRVEIQDLQPVSSCRKPLYHNFKYELLPHVRGLC